MADRVFGEFEQIGPIRVSPYIGEGASALPIRVIQNTANGQPQKTSEISGLRIVWLTSLVFLLMVLGARFIILGILEHPTSVIYQRVLPLLFMCSLLAGLYVWALVTALRSRKSVPKSAEPLFAKTREVPSDASLAVVRIRNMKSTNGWVWIHNGKLWFSGEHFWFCLGPSDFRSKSLFRDHGSPLKLPKGLCLREIKVYIFEPDGRPLAKQLSQQFQNRIQSELYDDPSSRALTVFPPLSVPSEPVAWGRIWAGSIAIGALFMALGASLYFLLPEFDGLQQIGFLKLGLIMGVFPLVWPFLVWAQDQMTRTFSKDEAEFRKRVQITI